MEQKTPQDGIYIKITENGPYLVYGNPLIKQEYTHSKRRRKFMGIRTGADFYAA